MAPRGDVRRGAKPYAEGGVPMQFDDDADLDTSDVQDVHGQSDPWWQGDRRAGSRV